MKRLIIASIETDGHSGSCTYITTSEEQYLQAMRSLLYYEDEQIYELKHEEKIGNMMIEQFYEGDLGEMSVLIRTFKAYKEIENAEFYTRTG